MHKSYADRGSYVLSVREILAGEAVNNSVLETSRVSFLGDRNVSIGVCPVNDNNNNNFG